MPSEEMLKQLLDEFVEKEALVREELKFVEEQVEQLEEKLAACRARMAALVVDKEKVSVLKSRYSGGRFYQRGMQFCDADIAAFKAREAGLVRETEDAVAAAPVETMPAAPIETAVNSDFSRSDNDAPAAAEAPEPVAVAEEVISPGSADAEGAAAAPEVEAPVAEAPAAEAPAVEPAPAFKESAVESRVEPAVPAAEITSLKARKVEGQSSRRAARSVDEAPAASEEEPDALASVLSGMALGGGGEPKAAKGAAISSQGEVQANSLELAKTESAKAQEPGPAPDLTPSASAETGNSAGDAQAAEPSSSLHSATERSTRVSSGGIKSILGLRRAIATPPPPAPTLSPWEAAEAEAAARAANSPVAAAAPAGEATPQAPAPEPVQAGEPESQPVSQAEPAQDAFGAVMHGPMEQAADSAPSQADALIDQLEQEMQEQVQAVTPAAPAQHPAQDQAQVPQGEDGAAAAASDTQESSEESDGDSDTVKSINDALRSLFR